MQSFEVLIPIVLFFVVYLVIKTVSDNRLRQKLADKGLVDEKVKYLFAQAGESSPMNALKWGIVLVAIGVALFAATLLPRLFDGPGAFGLMSIMAGVGFLVYYGIAKNKTLE
ncbi:MAG: hypothetical protein KDC45_13490 [Bacteroidetes bacterium]|nr:hypothetical protein [Bacteroidota bacterium]